MECDYYRRGVHCFYVTWWNSAVRCIPMGYCGAQGQCWCIGDVPPPPPPPPPPPSHPIPHDHCWCIGDVPSRMIYHPRIPIRSTPLSHRDPAHQDGDEDEHSSFAQTRLPKVLWRAHQYVDPPCLSVPLPSLLNPYIRTHMHTHTHTHTHAIAPLAYTYVHTCTYITEHLCTHDRRSLLFSSLSIRFCGYVCPAHPLPNRCCQN